MNMKMTKMLLLLIGLAILSPGSTSSTEQTREKVARVHGGGGGRRMAVEGRVRPYRIDRQSLLSGDFDGDGISNGADPCWFTELDPSGGGAGAYMPVSGCTLLDIIQMPDPLAGKLRDAIDDAVHYTEMYGGPADIIGDLETTRPMVDAAVAMVRSGDACAGQTQLAAVSGDLFLVEESFASLISDGHSLLGEPGDPEDDVREAELEISDLDFLMSQVKLARDAADELASAVEAVCDSAVPGLDTAGVVDRFDDSRRRVYLTDGRVFALAEDVDLSDGAATEGEEVTITGVDLADGTGTAFGVHRVLPLQAKSGFFASCAALRVAPIQPFAPIRPGPYVLHDMRAYRYASPFQSSGSVYRLEAGMRLGAERVCGGESSVSGYRYSMSLHLDYVKKGVGTTPLWLAGDMTPSSEPVPLPYDADPAFPATLTARYYVSKCTFGNCGPTQYLGKREYTLHLVERGSMCSAVYDQTLFDINDREPGWLQRTHVKQLISFAVSDGNAQPEFLAEGYGSQDGYPLTSTYPNTVVRIGSQKFAIHPHDIVPIFMGINAFERRYLELAYGVDHAAGLVWPRARGFRNQKRYQYSCTLPTIVRDLVDSCPNKTVDAYYHMPFPSGIQWEQGQGNRSDCGCTGPNCRTHRCGYAYDMLKGCGNSILAARSGRVIFVRESKSQQVAKWCCQGQPGCLGCSEGCCSSSSTSCDANELRILHQDGSVGQYVHFPMNGIFPKVGDIVRRGQPVGTVGLTGNTSGPHLHFAARTPGGLTHLALFEAVDPGTAANPQPHLVHCYEPQENDPIFSNNKECTTCPPL